jgi:hypothetical protein
MGKSIAFKCTYNNGGEGRFVGFSGTCTQDNIIRNIEAGRYWCSNPNNKCRQYYDEGFRGSLPEEPCDESILFTKWQFGAGWHEEGEEETRYIHMNEVSEDKFAILTTRFPGDPERDRRIIGLFQIERVDNTRETIVFATPDSCIRLSLKETKALYFWAYHNTKPGRPDWRTGLFRYLDDEQVHRILVDVEATVRDEETRMRIRRLIDKEFGNAPPPPANGCLSEKSMKIRIK